MLTCTDRLNNKEIADHAAAPVLLRTTERTWFGTDEERVYNPLARKATLLRYAFSRQN